MSNLVQQNFTFVWKINKLCLWTLKKGECLSSPTFVVNQIDKTEWYICLFPKGWIKSDKFLCGVYRTANDSEAVQIDVMISMSTNGLSRLQYKQSYTFLKDPLGFEIPSETVQLLELNNLFSSRESFTVCCKMWKCKNKPTTTTEPVPCLEPILSYLFHGNSDTQASSFTMCVQETEFANNLKSKVEHLTQNLYPFPIKCVARTEAEATRLSFLWRIIDFNHEDSTMKSSTPIFFATKGVPTLFVTQYMSETDTDSTVQIDIRQIGKKCKWEMACRITVLDVRGDSKCFKEDEFSFDANGDPVWKIPPFLKKSELITNEELYLPNKVMSLRFEFVISQGKRTTFIERTLCEFEVNKKLGTTVNTLGESMLQLQEIGKFCDTSFQVEGKIFEVHRAVFCSQSSVFSAMFERDMTEKETGVVVIEDIDADTFAKLLNFLYSSSLDELDLYDAVKLYTTADKYEIIKLMDLCSIHIRSGIAVSNVCEILSLGDLHKDPNIIAAAQEFVCDNFQEVLHSKEWKMFMKNNVDLAWETQCKIFP